MSNSEEVNFETKCLGGVHAEKITPDIPINLFDLFSNIINSRSNHFFYTNANLFFTVGMNIDDIKSISMCYLSSFLAHQSVMVEGKKRNQYIQEYHEKESYGRYDPDDKEFLDRDRAIFSIFLQQRLTSLVKTLIRKRKDINGFYSRDVVYWIQGKPKLVDMRALSWLTTIEKESLGFFKITGKKMEHVSKNMKNIEPNTYFTFEGKTYYKHKLIVKKNMHEFYQQDDDSEFENLKNRFNNLPETKRLSLIKKFIKKNENKASKKNELNVAKELLSNLKVA